MLPTKIITRDKILSLNSPADGALELPKINKTKLKLLENADFLTPGEKLELLMILTRHHFTGEIKLRRLQKIKELLVKLNLPYFINSRMHSKKGQIKWIQISANQVIHQFVQKNSKTMSSIEAGLLYGYPPTAILAFMNLIPRKTGGIYHPADYWFSLVRSKDWNTEERQYYRKIFQNIKKISPGIYTELVRGCKEKGQ